ncbi:hypothetical protein ACIBF6_39380 [Streptosporangium amethystogenes]|uniref:hypothetical protein n=1 Tax=Streptosporangium amethystogenes TaxID=2002 RepID=UPI0037A9E516
MPTAEEVKRLGMPKNVPLLCVYAAVRDVAGHALVVAEVLLPADRHELKEAYPISGPAVL